MNPVSWHFYIPLAERLPVPDGFTFIHQPSAPLRTRSGEITDTPDGVAIKMHSVETESGLRREYAALDKLLSNRSTKSTRARGFLGLDRELTRYPASSTIAEVVVEKRFGEVENEVGQDPSIAFDFAITKVNEVVNAISMILRTPFPLVRRESLPPGLPFAEGLLRPRDFETSKMPRVRALGTLHINNNFPEKPDVEESRIELRKWLDVALPRASIPGPWQTAKGFFHEAERYRIKSGNYALAIVLYASSCETFLDELVQHMLWEQNLAPHEAVPHFMRKDRPHMPKGIVSLVASEIHPLFSDQARADGVASEFQSWKEDVVDMRNRVIHAGYAPTVDETDKAADSVQRLFEHIGNELFDIRNRYPVTCLALLGEDGLERRGSYQELLNREPSLDYVINRMQTFRRWSNYLQELREQPKLLGSEIKMEQAYACLHRTDMHGYTAYAVSPGSAVAKKLSSEVVRTSEAFADLAAMVEADPYFFGNEPVVFKQEAGGFEIPANAVWDLYGYEVLPRDPMMYEELEVPDDSSP